MPKVTKRNPATVSNNAATLDLEAKLWAAADALRNNMDAAEYKHVVLGLIFLKYISDAFEAKHAELDAQRAQGDARLTRISTTPFAKSSPRRWCPTRLSTSSPPPV